MRTKGQKIWDYIAILKLFDAVGRISSVDGNLKVQKLAFLTELEGIRANLAAMHLKFFRYTHGPYSKDLANDVENLTYHGAITRTRRLTKKGQFILDYIAPEISHSQRASEAFSIIENISNQYGKKSGSRLVDLVYKMTVPVYDFGGQSVKVEEIDHFTDILVPTAQGLTDIDMPNADMIAEIEEELALPLDALNPTNPDYQRTVNAALERVKHALTA